MKIEERDRYLVLQPQDKELGADVAEAFKSEALAAVSGGKGTVLLDLSTVQFMDSSGLSALVVLMKKVRPAGGIALTGVRPGVQEILRLTRLEGILPVFASREDAVGFLLGEGEEERRAAGGTD